MHFTTIFATTLALALGVAAQPQHHSPLTVDQAKTQCGGGHMACCLNDSEIKADGVASGLLSRGLLTDVLGSSDQSCAKWELIENFNLLGFTKQGHNGQSCKSVTACCPEGKGSCKGI